MPAPVSATVFTTPSTIDKLSSGPHAKKTRLVRRRGRGQNGIESDDEIEREVRSDSDTDDQSSFDSESGSDTTQSPPPLEIDGHPSLNASSSKSLPVASDAGPFVHATDWADMVAAENLNGVEDLPVIDFADLDRHGIDQQLPPPPRSRKSHRPAKKHIASRSLSAPPSSPPARPPQAAESGHVSDTEQPMASASVHAPEESHPSRLRGQSARQAYQQRLESDPSYVPTVGEFWGHDDRLLDKDLRSLSGWWRGRWQSRGRGRGGFSMRGRGGSGFYPGRVPMHPQDRVDELGGPSSAVPPAEVPPIDQPWTHDGFEEMRRRDDRQPQASFRPQRGFAFRGRGGFIGARGRGGFGRGGSTPSPTGYRLGLPPGAAPGRIWYAMKPERMWTKQHDAFLYFDTSLKPRPGQGPGYRVKVPGGKEEIVRAAPRRFGASSSAATAQASSSQDDGERQFTVRLPRKAGKEKAKEEVQPTVAQTLVAEEPATTVVELSIEEVFTVRPNVVPNRRIDIPVQPQDPTSYTVPPLPAPASFYPPVPVLLSQPQSPASSLNADKPSAPQVPTQSMVAQASGPGPSVQIQESVPRKPSTPEESLPSQPGPSIEEARAAPPTLHPLQTAFSPIPQTSPLYGSPFGYAPALPPGIGMSQHGMPYELATGRAVFIQPTPPPMFTPRPMMHSHMAHPSTSVPFVPSYMQHQPSPDFVSHSHTPPMNSFIDASTGTPIFAPARQSSRIEIRAPVDSSEGKKVPPRPSGLRTSVSSSGQYGAAEIQVQQPASLSGSSDTFGAAPVNGVPTLNGASLPNDMQQPVEPQQFQAVDPAMVYAPYQQQYYYPEQYGYPAYMDMSPPVMQYETYPASAEHRPPPPQPMIYY
ncbi:predicted protein [Sparassis crispa]|uniref:Btz domain-containing protein n=1 Tax=Sparassis crispa TaxID=139825 RepID=A0A401GCI7_9APHY|nr:predicted protein [Sparassis crispa]GBE79872.1 predicted protein [Sparassis crispa]